MTKVRTSFRFEVRDIDEWRKYAAADGLTLSEWMRRRLNVEDSGVAKGKVKAAGNDEKKGRAREKAQAEYTPSGVTPTSPRTHEVELTDAEKRLAHGGWTTEQILRRRKKP